MSCEQEYGMCQPGANSQNPGNDELKCRDDNTCNTWFSSETCSASQMCCLGSTGGACCPFGNSCDCSPWHCSCKSSTDAAVATGKLTSDEGELSAGAPAQPTQVIV